MDVFCVKKHKRFWIIICVLSFAIIIICDLIFRKNEVAFAVTSSFIILYISFDNYIFVIVCCKKSYSSTVI